MRGLVILFIATLSLTAQAFSAGAMNVYMMRSVLTRRVGSSYDEEPDSKEPVPTSTATPTAIPTATPTAKPIQPEVKRTASENSALIGLGFLCLAFFRMTIVGW